jgi:uncharacterized protein YdaT
MRGPAVSRGLAMPWSTDYYPKAMEHLSAEVRAKAIEIANALLAEGDDEGMAIRVGIARAKQWGARRGIPVSDREF